ncbi:hypothetical protein BpHYR1_036053 [Brachionus plicatilis]|uniref:Uncharacterized protein n=1 Tax=Brachionus plicatilis TaxID=10195 RepID=A0A3M7RZJ7_BRAPC|nr:hypothetical protein BpHYR1_036053 [Brachionus plicatilis]
MRMHVRSAVYKAALYQLVPYLTLLNLVKNPEKYNSINLLNHSKQVTPCYTEWAKVLLFRLVIQNKKKEKNSKQNDLKYCLFKFTYGLETLTLNSTTKDSINKLQIN